MALRTFSEIGTGGRYPPDRERARIDELNKWYKRYQRQFADNQPRIKTNSYRFVCNFYQDQVISSPPTFTYDGDARQQEFVELVAPSVVEATRDVIVDLIRYGHGVYTNAVPFEVGNIDPRYYFMVARPEVQQKLGSVTVLPWIENVVANVPDRIAITRYDVGRTTATTSFHKLENLTIGSTVAEPSVMPAMSPILVSHGEGAYGQSWFDDMEEYVEDLHRRESKLSEALDKHTEPHLAVHESMFTVLPDGTAVIATDQAGVLPMPDEADVAPQFITWEAKTEAQQDSIYRSTESIQRFAAIAPVLTQNRNTRYSLPSGSALRRLGLVTVTRINTIREILSPAMRQAIANNAEVVRGSGVDAPQIDSDNIGIEWPLPLQVPGDEEGMENGKDNEKSTTNQFVRA